MEFRLNFFLSGCVSDLHLSIDIIPSMHTVILSEMWKQGYTILQPKEENGHEA